MAVATLVGETCILHPKLDSDLLMAAALLHDVGKVREFTYGAEFGLTEEGELLGHLAIGAEIIGGAAGGLAARAARRCSHCVLSHHGPAQQRARHAGRARASAAPRRWRSIASTPSTRASRARSSTGSLSRAAGLIRTRPGIRIAALAGASLAAVRRF